MGVEEWEVGVTIRNPPTLTPPTPTSPTPAPPDPNFLDPKPPTPFSNPPLEKGVGVWDREIVFASNRLRVKLSSRQVARIKFVCVKSSASNCLAPRSPSENSAENPWIRDRTIRRCGNLRFEHPVIGMIFATFERTYSTSAITTF